MTLNTKLVNMFCTFTETISEPSVFYSKEAKEWRMTENISIIFLPTNIISLTIQRL